MEQYINIKDLGFTETLTPYEFDAIKELTNSGGLSYDPTIDIVTLYLPLVKDGLTKEAIVAKAKELELNKRKETIRTSIISLCSTLTLTVKEIMTYKNVTPDQEERYKIKRDAAIKDDVSAFELEGSIIGKDPLDLMNYVKELTIEWENTNNTMLLKIDAIRVKLNSILANEEYGYLEYVIEYIKINLVDAMQTKDLLALLETIKVNYETYLKEQATLIEEEVEDTVVLSDENQSILNNLSNETITSED